MKHKIGIIEDNELINRMIKINLEKSGYKAVSFSSGESLLSHTSNEQYDLFILDIMLPGISGLEVLKRLSKSPIHDRTPVLMLTVQQQIETKIDALNSGADDYLCKPFNMDELLARVNALIRRSHRNRPGFLSAIVEINGFKINLSTRECESNKGTVTLSEKETKLLEYFSRNAGKTLHRADILEEVWGMDVSPTPRTIDNFVLKFRKLFETTPEDPKHFISVRNSGYRFENDIPSLN